jgi:anti-sigma B factor antagonist
MSVLSRTSQSRISASHVVPETAYPDERIELRALPFGCGLDIRSATRGGACTVTVIGEVDSLTAPLLQECVLGVLARPDVSGDVVVDLHRVTFLSAAGLTALASARQAADRTGHALRLRCGPTRAVTRVLQLTNLWNDFSVIE